MGRRKVEIKRIESKSSRQVTFCKRRNGLMEKARQLSILCESSVAVVVVSATGKVYSFSSGDSMAKILSCYETQHDDDLKTLTELMMEFMKTLQEKEKLLREENQILASQLTEMGKMKKFHETEDERTTSPGNSSSNNPPVTLPLLK